MALHKDLPFAEWHKAKINAGLAANRPAAPDGTGDAYVSTDTHVLSLCLTTSSPHSWTAYDLDNIVPFTRYAGIFTDTNQVVTDSSTYTADFPITEVHDSPPGYTADNQTFTVEEDGVYLLSVSFGFADAGVGWSVEIYIAGVSYALYTINTTYSQLFSFTSHFNLTANDTVTVDLQQVSGSDKTISYERISLEKLSNV